MIEVIIKNYLEPILGVPVSTEHKEQDPQTFVVIERVGGSSENHVRTASVAIQSYAPTMYQAAQLHEQVLTAMDNIMALDDIGWSSLNAEYNYTDEETKKPRYQALFDISYY